MESSSGAQRPQPSPSTPPSIATSPTMPHRSPPKNPAQEALVSLLDSLDPTGSLSPYAGALLSEGLASDLITEMAEAGMIDDLVESVRTAVEKTPAGPLKEGTKLKFRLAFGRIPKPARQHK